MAATGTVGISRVVLYRRERAVMLEPCGKGIVAWTLRYGDEVRDAAPYFEDVEDEKPDPKLMKLVANSSTSARSDWDPGHGEGSGAEGLKQLIASKQKKKPAKATPPHRGRNPRTRRTTWCRSWMR